MLQQRATSEKQLDRLFSLERSFKKVSFGQKGQFILYFQPE